MTTTICKNYLTDSLSSDEYHSFPNTFSSSQLKTILQDPELFYGEYIAKTIPKKESNSFDVGTYFHTAVLEPELLEKECAVFMGSMKRGKDWDTFKEEHKGKAIISRGELETANIMIEAVKNSPISMGFLNGYKKELSAFVTLYVLEGAIYSVCNEDKVYKLVANGWKEDNTYDEDSLEFCGVVLRLKVRADSINIEEGVVSDLKSTTGNTKDAHEMRTKIDAYSYDLSASLYLDLFSMACGKPNHINRFIWIFASKNMGNAKSWEASKSNIIIGRAKWKKAVLELAKYINNGWTFCDSLDVLEPSHFQKEWISEE